MKKIIELLSAIYDDPLDESVINTFISRVKKAKDTNLKTRKQGWDERDVVLITYADQFHQQNEKTLKTLNDFYHRWLANSFSHVHLLPFYPWSSDDGFSVIDYHQVDAVCGDWQDVAQLNKSTSLMFDFVCNHISAKSHWFTEYLAGNPEYQNFFISVEPRTDLSKVTRPRALPLLSPFTLADGSQQHIWTTFSDDQIDLNFANPLVLLAMVDVLLRYLQEGADYIRLDAVGYMWKTIGTNCIHLEKTHQLVKLFRAVVDTVAPGTVLITETNVPHKDNISYLGNGHDEAQMVYQFPLPPLVLHAIHTGSAQVLSQWANSLSDATNGNTTWFNFLASHDGIGLNPLRGILPEEDILQLVNQLQDEGARVNWKNNPDGTRSPYEINVTYMDALNRRDSSDEERLARFILAHAILLAFPGVPAIYVQSILGSRNDEAGVERLGYNRAINRQKYERHAIESQLLDENSLRQQVYKQLSHLINVRKNHRAFHPDSSFITQCINGSVLEIKRTSKEGNHVTALFNLSHHRQQITLPGNNIQDLISGIKINGKQSYEIQPYQVLWLSY
ncbi:sugar phosphorylase [Buttiauxella sp. A2-C2_NF]|uniref:sugar phosphorylase n=1 Tax=Buttiauxella ferragutiae TaxID=82989 RepID=UPI001E382454|nr:sugar phosphorylase [Buttiauxella ferragutiae]MCE0824566.1 sugar phosphorylase [Buttiauxella ferragutiae]UNK63561.1 sugar phosphorylase [Buttiauxella ferragutiae]